MDANEAYNLINGPQKDRSDKSTAATQKKDAGQRRDTRQDQKGDQGEQNR